MCSCTLCRRHRRIVRATNSMNHMRKNALIRELEDTLDHVEADRDYFRALVHGCWPNADEVIAESRKGKA